MCVGGVYICIYKLTIKKSDTMKAIKTLTSRLICDYNCIITAELLEIKGDYATILYQKNIIRRKIKTSFDGSKYILPDGNYSMAPSFTL